MSLDIGKMRHRIEVQYLRYKENEIGECVKEWSEYKKIWTEKKQLRGDNPNHEGKEGIEYKYRFKSRYRQDIEEHMRIVSDGIIYDIKNINHIKELSPYTTIDCVIYKEGVYNE